jgi:hypothetical protein
MKLKTRKQYIILTLLVVGVIALVWKFSTAAKDQKPMVISAVNTFAAQKGYPSPIISVDYIKSTLARGNIGDTGVGGGKWFAAKIEGKWTVVHMGNGMPKCADVEQYKQPKSFLNCY